MKIKQIEAHSEADLIGLLRRVSMLEAPDVRPYEEAFISLERLRPDQILPTQTYVLRSEFEKVRALRWSLQEHGVDLFDMNGYLTIHPQEEAPFDLLPPIIEESIEADGALCPLINDGMHRLFLAWREWLLPKVVYVRGAPKHLSYYAYPLRGGWGDVRFVEDREELGMLKKYHRIRDNKRLYRNFNSAFRSVGLPRGRKPL